LNSCGSSIFSLLRSLHNVFHNGCTNLHFQQWCIMVPFPSHSCQHLLLFAFLQVTILTKARWNHMWFWFVLPLWPRMFRILHVFFSYLDHFLWKKLCSVDLPISLLDHWFIGSLVFWSPCTFWLLIPCQLYSWQRFSPIL
jgi:hypothetical protein